MKIEMHEIPIREVVAGYVDNAEEGCRGYGGRLNIRPAYQREFVYKMEQRDAVIDSIKKNFNEFGVYDEQEYYKGKLTGDTLEIILGVATVGAILAP